jgi:CxxC motif-containing protein (DUF1111 family)
LSHAFVFACVVASPAAFADPFDESHLFPLPRTQAETARITRATSAPMDFTRAQPFEALSGGAATLRLGDTQPSFSHPSANMPFEDKLTFELGRAMFEKIWVSSPSSTKASDGLGPLYNARSCGRCHPDDGRGHPPESHDDNAVSMFLRISIPATGAETAAQAMAEIRDYIATAPEPTYGLQLQDEGLAGHPPEYRLQIDYEEVPVPLSDGETASLRAPRYTAADLGYGPLHPDAMLSPRVAPQMIGLGLLEAIRAKDILAMADPEDADGDGISGRPNIVWSAVHERPMLGRFGHKAGMPTVLDQTASAFAGDIGISTPVFPAPWGDCSQNQETCRAAQHGDQDVRGHEVDQQGLSLTTFYTRNLAVPARRDVEDPQVLRGKEIFHSTGCAACHTPSYVTHRLKDRPEQSFQLIWPYTDMLLHDMGPGLADNRPEAVANGREWRTPPLWGIGLTKIISGHSFFLHDGRARSLLEAILWHGGEAQPQRDAVIDMPSQDRAALIRFLESL